MNYIVRPLALDRASPSQRSAFIRAKKLEANYAKRLRRIAKHIGDIVREFAGGTLGEAAAIGDALNRYARLIEPWAVAVGQRMVTEVAQRDELSWKQTAAKMGRALHREIQTAPTRTAMRQLMAEQVGLITSLPTEAAERVHKMTMQGIVEGKRASEIAKVILETGEVTKSRATLIARTEVSRTATILTQVRAQHIGSEFFKWSTVGDSDVRPSHKKLNGQVFRWDTPPECDPGIHALPGAVFNCRCIPIPILPDDLG